MSPFMTRCRVPLLVSMALALLAVFPSPGRGAAVNGPAAASCRPLTAAFMEQLEPVVEAMIDGHPAAQPAAAARATRWWKLHRDRMPMNRGVDSLMTAMARARRARGSLPVARLALEALLAAIRACPDDGVDRQVMLLDAAGMASWLTSQAEPTVPPGEVMGAAGDISARLLASGHPALARRVHPIVGSALGTHASALAARRDALTLLDFVDEVELALARPVHARRKA